MITPGPEYVPPDGLTMLVKENAGSPSQKVGILLETVKVAGATTLAMRTASFEQPAGVVYVYVRSTGPEPTIEGSKIVSFTTPVPDHTPPAG